MACTDDKFVINRGMINEFLLTIKQNDSTLPMPIDSTDIFVVKIFELGTDVLIATIDKDNNPGVGQVTVKSADGGQLVIRIDDDLVDLLDKENGTKVDGYYIRPTYRLAMDCVTVANGNFVAKINKVYVD